MVTDTYNLVNGLNGTEKEVSIQFMKSFLEQPDCNPEENCFVLETSNSLEGYALIIYEKPLNRAVYNGGIVSTTENLDMNDALLSYAVETARSMGADKLHIEVSSDATKIQQSLRLIGFIKIKEYWQMRWEENSIPVANLDSEFSTRSFILGKDEETLTTLQNLSFGDNWGFSPNTVGQIEARVRLPGRNPEDILFITHGQEVAAYNWTILHSKGSHYTGIIGMTGVHPKFRGKGLGTAVVKTGIEYLKNHGAGTVELEVDSDNIIARELYLKLGFQKVSQSFWYELAL